jgi:CheY-like chemotaxis protein
MSSPLRILVIDDDPVMRELLEALLGYAGHRVEVVDSGIAALARLESHTEHFDVVLTDLHMPVLQGKELAGRLLASREPETLLLGMSGSSPTEDETHLLDEFLKKPFTPEQFEQALLRARSTVASGTHPVAAAPASKASVDDPILDETVFIRLSGMLPAEQLRGLYELTLDDIQGRLERMKAHAASGDTVALRAEAHAIKGGTGMVGARQIYALAARIETGDPFDFEIFTLACHRLRRMLDERLSTPAPASKKI